VEIGSLAIVWPCVDASDQYWRIVDIGEGLFKLINQHSGKALSTLNGGGRTGLT
jgi:Ricin-type beta-trefoil lectin domain-like